MGDAAQVGPHTEQTHDEPCVQDQVPGGDDADHPEPTYRASGTKVKIPVGYASAPSTSRSTR